MGAIMMGTRGYRGGDECDAFSRRARQIMRTFEKAGRAHYQKRKFWRRIRRSVRRALKIPHDMDG
jgi:hypothetical protein